MFHKKCNICRNKTCLETKSICKSLNKWLSKNIEKSQQNRLLRSSKRPELQKGCQEELSLYETMSYGDI